MKVVYNKDRFLIFFFVCLSSFLVVLSLNLFLLWSVANKEIETSNRFYQSMKIVGELRQGSDDLTKMIRLYVLTGNPTYLEEYKEILSIRNGTSPRPVDYDENYWDFVLEDGKRPRPYGKAISLKQMMINEGFSKEELALLETSQQLSDNLVRLELEAVDVMQGRYDDGSQGYVVGTPNPELARRLVSGDVYMREKAKIMTPLLEFSRGVHQRTMSEMMYLRKQVLLLILLAIAFAVLSSISLWVCFVKATKSFKEATFVTEGLLLNILPRSVAERFKKEGKQIVDECQASVLFVHIRHFASSFSVDTLNRIYEGFDFLAERYGVEKIKVIGDSYIVAAGVPAALKDHEGHLADFALALNRYVEDFNKESGFDFNLRMGMSCGVVMAGIVGVKKFIYDIWGSVVAEAAFLESSGIVGKIQVSEKMAKILENRFDIEESVKDSENGSLERTYFLIKRK